MSVQDLAQLKLAIERGGRLPQNGMARVIGSEDLRALLARLEQAERERGEIIKLMHLEQHRGGFLLPAEPGPADCKSLPDAVSELLKLGDNEHKKLEASEAALRTLRQAAAKGKVAWMDSLHFKEHLENDIKPQQVFVSEQSLRDSSQCIDTDGWCTAQKVLIFDAKSLAAALAAEGGK